MSNNQETKSYRKGEQFQCTQRDLMTYMNEAMYWQKMELVGFILSFVTAQFAIFCIFATEKPCM